MESTKQLKEERLRRNRRIKEKWCQKVLSTGKTSSRTLWKNLRAVRQNRVYPIDYMTWSSRGDRGFEKKMSS